MEYSTFISFDQSISILRINVSYLSFYQIVMEYYVSKPWSTYQTPRFTVSDDYIGIFMAVLHV